MKEIRNQLRSWVKGFNVILDAFDFIQEIGMDLLLPMVDSIGAMPQGIRAASYL